jgi:hypothetical protein
MVNFTPPTVGGYIRVYTYTAHKHTHMCSQSEKYQYAWHTISLLLRNSNQDELLQAYGI